MSQSNYGLPTPRTFNPQGQTPPTLQVSSMLSGIFCFIPLCNPSCCTSLWVSPIPLWVTIYLFSPLHLREHSRMPGGRGSKIPEKVCFHLFWPVSPLSFMYNIGLSYEQLLTDVKTHQYPLKLMCLHNIAIGLVMQ